MKIPILKSSTGCTTLPNPVHTPDSTETSQTFYYVAPTGSNGQNFDSFTFRVSDGTYTSNASNIVVNVQKVYTPPVCGALPSFTINQTMFSVLSLSASSLDQPSSTLKYYIISQCKSGTLFQVDANGNKAEEINANAGKVLVTDSQHRIMFSPLKGDSGSPYCSIGYTAVDNNGFSCTEFITANVLKVNQAPVAYATIAQGLQNTPVTIFLRGSDSDGNGLLNCYVTSQPASGTLYQYSSSSPDNRGAQILGASDNNKILVTDSNCRVVFVPAPNAYGVVDSNGVKNLYSSFNYQVKDESLYSLTAPVMIGITRTIFNGPTPTLTQLSTNESVQVCFTLSASLDENSPITKYTIVNVPSTLAGSLSLPNGQSITASQLPYSVPADGRMCFTPAQGYNSKQGMATFTYTATDSRATGVPTTVNVNVVPSDKPAVAIQPTPFTGFDGTPIQINLLGTDEDRTALSFCIPSGTYKGKFYLDAAATQPLFLSSTGCTNIPNIVHNSGSTDTTATFYYVSPTGVTGSPYETIPFTVSDGITTSTKSAEVNIISKAVAPVCADVPPITINQGGYAILTLNSTNPSMQYYISSSCRVGGGVLFQTNLDGSRGAPIDVSSGPVKLDNNRVYFQPVSGESGTPYCSFGYYALDTTTGLSCAVKYVQTNVNRVNTPPTALPVYVQGLQNAPVVVTLNPTSVDNCQLTCYLNSMPLTGTVYQYSATAPDHKGAQIIGVSSSNRVLLTDSSCRLVFAPTDNTYGNSNQNGVLNYYTTFDYVVNCNQQFSTPSPVSIGVTQTIFTGPTPTFTDSVNTTDGKRVCFTLTASLDNNHPVQKFLLYALPSALTGYLSLPNGQPFDSSSLVASIPADGQLCYTPPSGYCDTIGQKLGVTGSFVYAAADDRTTGPRVSIPLHVACINRPPVAVLPTPFTGVDDSPVPITFIASDSNYDKLTFCINNCPDLKGKFYYDVSLTKPIALTPGTCTPLDGVVHSSTSVESSVKFYYVAPKGAKGTPYDKCTFAVSDGNVALNATVFQINIDQSNSPPQCADIPAVHTVQNSPTIITLSAADREQPESTLNFFINADCVPGTLFQMNGAQRGDVINPSNGPVKVTDPAHRIIFVPLEGQFGPNYCSFGFSAVDNGGLACSPISFVNIAVDKVNYPPVCPVQSVQGAENTATTVSLYPTQNDGSVILCSITGLPARGTLYQYSPTAMNNIGAQITSASSGTPAPLSDSKCRVVFVPAPGEYGLTAKGVNNYYSDFRYTATNNQGLTCAESSISVGVIQTVFPPPVVTTPPVIYINQTTVTSLFNMSVVNGMNTTCRLLALPDPRTGTLRLPGSSVDITQNQLPLSVPGCQLQFVPNPTYNELVGTQTGTFPYVIFTVNDGKVNSNPFTVFFNVTPVATTPIAIQPPRVISVPGTPTVITLIGSDNTNGLLTFCIQNFPTSGDLYVKNADGTLGTRITRNMIDSKGCVSIPGTVLTGGQTSVSLYYVSNSTAAGTDSFTYVVKGTTGLTSTVQYQYINVTSVQNGPAPIAGPLSQVITSEGGSTIITLSGKDSNGLALQYYINTFCKPGTLFQVVNGMKGAPINSPGTLVTNPQGQVMFVPLSGESGNNYCNFGYYVKNSNGVSSSEYITPITVNRIVTPPSVIPVVGTTTTNTPVNLTLTGTDSQGGCLFTYIVGLPTKGTLYQADGTIITSASEAKPVLVTSPFNVVTFVPANGEDGSGSQFGVQNYYTNLKFLVQQCIGAKLNSSVSVVPISVTSSVSVINPPVPTLLNVTLNENQNVTINLSSTYTGQCNATYYLIDTPQRGQLYLNGQLFTLNYGSNGVVQPTLIPGGQLVYVPPTGLSSANGQSFADFTYITNACGYTVPQKVPLYVNTVAKPPVGTTPSPLQFLEAQVSSFNLTGYSETTPSNKLRFRITRLPVNGVFRQFDGSPVVLGQFIQAQKDLSGNVVAPAPLSYSTNQKYAYGMNFDNFEYQVVDQNGLASIPKSVQINIANVNNPPTAVLLSNTTGIAGQPLILWLGGTDADMPNDNLTAIISCFPENALLYQVTADGKPDLTKPITRTNNVVLANRPQSNYAGAIAYVPYTGFFGMNMDKLCFSVKDQSGLQSNITSFFVNILPTLPAPTTNKGIPNVLTVVNPGPGITVTLPASASADDVINTVISSFPTNGKLYNMDGTEITPSNNYVTDADNQIKFVPNDGSFGPGSFTYYVRSSLTYEKSNPSTVQYNIIPARPNTLPEVTISPVEYSTQPGGQKIGYISVTAVDQEGDQTPLVITKFPALKSGTLSINQKTISIGDAARNTNWVVVNPIDTIRDPNTGARTSHWLFVYRTSSDANDSLVFEVPDSQILSASQLKNYPSYTVPLTPSVYQSPFTSDSGVVYSGSVEDSEAHSGRSTWDKWWWWILLIIIAVLLCCCIILLCVVIAGLFATRGRTSKGPRRVKRKSNQPYENLGAYNPPNL